MAEDKDKCAAFSEELRALMRKYGFVKLWGFDDGSVYTEEAGGVGGGLVWPLRAEDDIYSSSFTALQ